MLGKYFVLVVRRSQWRRTKKGLWTCSLGERGLRVRLFDKRPNGVYYRAVWLPGEGRSVASLHTNNRTEAERLGKQLLGELFRGARPAESGPIRLGELWRRYSSECAAFLDNKERTRRDAKARARLLLAHFGPHRDVRTLSALNQLEYTRARRAGGIVLDDDSRTGVVRARSVEADFVLLHHMLSWATTVRTKGDGRWLERNPLAGVKREREKNPRRPVATWERFQATREAMRRLACEAKAGTEATRWAKLELTLVLAEATGRRLGSIRALRWEDIDLTRASIRWSAEADKKGVEWVIPIPQSLVKEVRGLQKQLAAVGGLVFAAERDPSRVMDRHLFDKWLSVAEREANLPKLKGSLWHAYRRKWASERKHHPLVDVAAAGGWRDTPTILECYQQPDEGSLLRVMSEPVKRSEGGVFAISSA